MGERGATMNVTAFLLVLTLTGLPVANAVCVTECRHQRTTSGHCHGDLATSIESISSASDSCDEPSMSEGPYVVEHRAAPGAAVLSAAMPVTPAKAGRTNAPAGVAKNPVGWLSPPLILRL